MGMELIGRRLSGPQAPTAGRRPAMMPSTLGGTRSGSRFAWRRYLRQAGPDDGPDPRRGRPDGTIGLGLAAVDDLRGSLESKGRQMPPRRWSIRFSGPRRHLKI